MTPHPPFGTFPKIHPFWKGKASLKVSTHVTLHCIEFPNLEVSGFWSKFPDLTNQHCNVWQDSSQSERLDKAEEKHIFVTRCLLRDKVQPFIKATVHVSKKQQQGFSSSVEVSFLSRVGNCFGETFASPQSPHGQAPASSVFLLRVEFESSSSKKSEY